MDDEVKAILSEIYGEMSDRLESSRRLQQSIRRLEQLGYQFSILMDATILLTRDPETATTPRRSRKKIARGTLRLDARDRVVLEKLKIRVDHRGSR